MLNRKNEVTPFTTTCDQSLKLKADSLQLIQLFSDLSESVQHVITQLSLQINLAQTETTQLKTLKKALTTLKNNIENATTDLTKTYCDATQHDNNNLLNIKHRLMQNKFYRYQYAYRYQIESYNNAP